MQSCTLFPVWAWRGGAGEAHGAEQGQVQGPAPWLRLSPMSAGTGGQTDGEMKEIPSWCFHICSMVSGGSIL